MFLARVQGHVVATAKDPGIAGRKLLVVEPLKLDYDTKGGGSLGETGSSSRMAEENGKAPTDAAVIGIVDEAVVLGKPVTFSTLGTKAKA